MILLQIEPFEPGALLSAFCQNRSETGAVVSFTGLTRGGDGATARLELEAYPGFALHDLLIVHRIGEIAPGEAIVFVATAAAHRREAFEAADHLMDYLKSRAPFWKKEHGPGGARWIAPTERDHADAARWD